MNAGQIMKSPVIATTPRASVRDIATQLVYNGFSGMPVTDPNGDVMGVITEADIIRVVTEGKQLETVTAQDIMSTKPVTVGVETPLEGVMKLLKEYHILRVPVTDHGKLVGIISRSDVIKALLEPEFLVFGR
jgi:CBS domain-containing protein